MDVRPLGPLEQKQCRIDVPINEYHVEFWTKDGNMWSSYESRLSAVKDVFEALEWADAEARRRGATYTIQAIIRVDGSEQEERVWLGGNNPTWGADEYERTLPLLPE